MAVTTQQVLEIMDGETTREDLSVFISQAETYYSAIVPDGFNSEAEKDIIIKYLAAHFVQISDGIVTEKKNGDFSEKYKMSGGSGIEATHFGRQAILFDRSNLLGGQSSNQASINFVGKE